MGSSSNEMMEDSADILDSSCAAAAVFRGLQYKYKYHDHHNNMYIISI